MFALFLFRTAFSFGLRTINPLNQKPQSCGNDCNSSKTLIVKEHTNLGKCACDITDQCDKNCCCDPDCPENIFGDDCLDELSNVPQSEKKALRKCSDPPIGDSGSLLDWIQRTMLCIHKDNNPSTGKFYELNDKSNSNVFTENESSLRDTFGQSEEKLLKPLLSRISDVSIFNSLNSKQSLVDLLRDNCQCNIEDCYVLNDNQKNIYFTYQENFDTEYKCNGNYSVNDEIIISDINCSNSSYCLANFTTIPKKTDSDSKEEENNNGTTVDPQSSLLEDNSQNNTTKIKFQWPFNSDARVSPRGYNFADPLKKENGQDILIEAPFNNRCFNTDTKMHLLFGMDLDFTCMTDVIIENCSLLYSNATKGNCPFLNNYQYGNNGNETDNNNGDGGNNSTDNSGNNGSGDGTIINNNTLRLRTQNIELNISKVLKVPYPADDQDNYTEFSNASEVLVNIVPLPTMEEPQISSLYLTGLTRSIAIFYKTIGYEHNPTHIIMDINVEYDYSTSILYLKTNYFPDYKNVTLRTVVRFFEYPNNINMYKGGSVNRKLQSWLPFDV